jgi:three-Cys-motif partner protein
MPGFSRGPFDQQTLTKLDIFELYAREWLPVFLAAPQPPRREVHVFDFFAGPGMDSKEVPGSPLRLLHQINVFRRLPGWSSVKAYAHFFDASADKVAQLRGNIERSGLCPTRLTLDIDQLEFHDALARHGPTLKDPRAAKLLLMDQFGVDQVPQEVFRRLVSFPTCDFLFFISSSALYRFRDHPAIRQKITRPDDYYHVHRAVLAYYRDLLPDPAAFYLAPFSIKRGANIYGVIFGSAHPLGMDKFLQVAWKKDEINGEANFDIERENLSAMQPHLPLADFRPTKLKAFERELEQQIRSGQFRDEAAVVRLSFEHGVKRQHAGPVLKKLTKERVIAPDFRVPRVDGLRRPRPLRPL